MYFMEINVQLNEIFPASSMSQTCNFFALNFCSETWFHSNERGKKSTGHIINFLVTKMILRVCSTSLKNKNLGYFTPSRFNCTFSLKIHEKVLKTWFFYAIFHFLIEKIAPMTKSHWTFFKERKILHRTHVSNLSPMSWEV